MHAVRRPLPGRLPVPGREHQVLRAGRMRGLGDVGWPERVPDRVAAGATCRTDGHDRQDRAVTSSLPDWMSSTLAADGAGGQGALPPWIVALSPEATVVGPALVVTVGRDDNSPMRRVPAAVSAERTVLVVAGAGESRTAVLGGLGAADLRRARVAAVGADGVLPGSPGGAGLGLP